MKNARLELRLPQATKERWEEYCAEHKVTFTDLIVQSVEARLRDEKSDTSDLALSTRR
jgi:hypothetical protein